MRYLFAFCFCVVMLLLFLLFLLQCCSCSCRWFCLLALFLLLLLLLLLLATPSSGPVAFVLTLLTVIKVFIGFVITPQWIFGCVYLHKLCAIQVIYACNFSYVAAARFDSWGILCCLQLRASVNHVEPWTEKLIHTHAHTHMWAHSVQGSAKGKLRANLMEYINLLSLICFIAKVRFKLQRLNELDMFCS